MLNRVREGVMLVRHADVVVEVHVVVSMRGPNMEPQILKSSLGAPLKWHP